MGYTKTKLMTKMLAEEFNEEKLYSFKSYGEGGRYTQRQKDYAFKLIEEYGIRATARILKVQRRTLQWWCREHYVWVKRCPSWIYGWAERRRKRRAFWQRRGYC